jgi:hypothetical protein
MKPSSSTPPLRAVLDGDASFYEALIDNLVFQREARQAHELVGATPSKDLNRVMLSMKNRVELK